MYIYPTYRRFVWWLISSAWPSLATCMQCEVHACPALLQGHMWRPVLCQQLPEHLHAHATGSRSAVSVVSNVNMPDNVKAKLSSSMIDYNEFQSHWTCNNRLSVVWSRTISIMDLRAALQIRACARVRANEKNRIVPKIAHASACFAEYRGETNTCCVRCV